MPGSATTPGHPSVCDGALRGTAFRNLNSVGTRDINSIADQWLAYAFPCRRFTGALAEARARLGADVDCYTFTAKTQRRMVSAAIGTVWDSAEAARAARAQWRTVAEQLRRKFPKLGELMDRAENDVLAFMSFP